MKTLLIRKGDRLEIRAIAGAADESGRDRCATLEFFEEHARMHPRHFDALSALLTRTAMDGPPHDPGKFKALASTEELSEFKTNFGLRLICFFDGGDLIVTTHGYLKDGQKMPKREIERAEQLKAQYFEAKGKGDLFHAQPNPSGRTRV